MNRRMVWIAGLLTAASTAFAEQPAVQAECGKVGLYQVEKTSFSKLPLESAIGKLLRITPIKVKVENGTGMVLSAEDVSGPLDVVLAKLAESSGFSYSQEGCTLLVKSNIKEPAKTWSVKSGATLRDTFTTWAGQSGWQLSWELQDDFTVGGNASYVGEFEVAVDSIMKSVKLNNPSLNHKFFYGNHMLRVWSGQESNARGDIK